MACFAVSAGLGILTTAFRKRFPENWHIDWLNLMLFGSTVAFGIEHFIKGEITPWPPFLTAMGNPADFSAMLGEMWAIGVPMMLGTVLAWAAIAIVYEKFLATSGAKASAGA